MAADGAGSAAQDVLKIRESWGSKLRESVKSDGWGQVVEAVEGYQELQTAIVEATAKLPINEADDAVLHDLVVVLKARCVALAGTGGPDSALEADDMKKVDTVLDDLFTERPVKAFPLDAASLPAYGARQWSSPSERLLEQPSRPGGLLIPRPAKQQGEQQISIEVKSVGIKGGDGFVNPFVRMTVLDPQGQPLEPKQETPFAEKQVRYRVDVRTVVHVQSSLQTLKERGGAIFLELVHFKEKKSKNSTRGWCLLEADEIELPGEKLLEVYRKPLDKSRKRFRLLTSKKLYMDVQVFLSAH